MRPTVYEYVVFYADDPFEFPVFYLSLDELVEFTGKSKNAINKFYHRALSNQQKKYMEHGKYLIERFKKESE